MVDTVTLPLSALNGIPGVGGVEDVELELVEPQDIRDPIDDQVPTLDDIRAAVREEIDESLADGVLANVDTQLDIDVPGADAVADAVLDRLDVEPGLFGPLDDPLDEVIDRAVREGLEDLDVLDVDLGALAEDDLVDLPDVVEEVQRDIQALIDDVQAVGDDLAEIDPPAQDDIQTAVEAGIRAAVPAVDETDLFTDPVGYVRALLGQAIDQAVSESTEEQLDQFLED